MACANKAADEFKHFLVETQVFETLKIALNKLLICDPKPDNPLEFICQRLNEPIIKKYEAEIMERKLNILKEKMLQLSIRNAELKQLVAKHGNDEERNYMKEIEEIIGESVQIDAPNQNKMPVTASSLQKEMFVENSVFVADQSFSEVSFSENEKDASSDVTLTMDVISSDVESDDLNLTLENSGQQECISQQTVSENVEKTKESVCIISDDEYEYAVDGSAVDCDFPIENVVNTSKIDNKIEQHIESITKFDLGGADEISSENLQDSKVISQDTTIEFVQADGEPLEHILQNDSSDNDGFAKELKQRLLGHLFEATAHLDQYSSSDTELEPHDDTLDNLTLSLTVEPVPCAAEYQSKSFPNQLSFEREIVLCDEKDGEEKNTGENISKDVKNTENDNDGTKIISYDAEDHAKKRASIELSDDAEIEFLLSKSFKCHETSTPFDSTNF